MFKVVKFGSIGASVWAWVISGKMIISMERRMRGLIEIGFLVNC
jgi:hypothetical protein